ncbi:MAG: peptidase S10, partial [Methylobacteriaceae bacterium]|nr:peptidase S10 [Methylobacteriaceae bacterium]
MIARLLLAALLLAAAPTLAPAQPTPAQPAPAANTNEAPRGRGGEGRAAPQLEGRRLPADVTTEHTLDLPGRSIRVIATAGALPLTDPSGAVQAEIGYVAYRLAGAAAATRPVTFAVNGGPGSASAYLHLLAVGPWRLPLDGATVSPS